MYERQIRPTTLNPQERSLLVRKAKADRLAFDAAQLLSRGETAQAVILAGESVTLAGSEQFNLWLRHYATTRFKVTSGAVDEFLSSVPPGEVAI